MLDAIRAALSEIAQVYRDVRVSYCRVEVAGLEGERCHLAGTVLDAATKADVVAALRGRFAGLTFDAGQVRVLRGDPPRLLVVATNLTGLYAGPSFLAEQVSQLLNGWPVEALMEEGRWCFVRLPDGYLGWTYLPYLTDKAIAALTHIVCEPVSELRAAPSVEAPLVNRILGGTALTAEIEGRWTRIVLAGDPLTLLRPETHGWLLAGDLRAWSAMPVDAASRRRQIIGDATRFIGVPYLWGGCTALGIDCSGFAQLLHRLSGLIIPRDADMQFNAGQPAGEPFQPGDLLFFGEGAAEACKITHAGVSLGGWRIIHSSRSRNGVQEDDVQAVEHLRENFMGARTFLS